jgi:drug/metabolite transporter (DMT)-like permease
MAKVQSGVDQHPPVGIHKPRTSDSTMNENDSTPDKKTLGAFLVVVLLLGGNFIAVKYSNAELAPFWGATLRFALSTIVLVAIMSFRRLAFPRGKQLQGAVLYGLSSFGVLYALLYWALLYVPSGLTSVLFATLPLMTLVMAALVGLEKLRPANILGSLIVIGGVVLISGQQLDGTLQIWPIAAIILGVATGAASTIIVKRLGRPSPVSLNAVGIATGTVFLFLSSLLAKETITLPSLMSTWLALGYLVFSTVVAFILFVWIVGRWVASSTSYALVLAPIVTIVFAALLLGEQVTISFLIGAAVVMVGVYIGAIKTTKNKA